MPDKQRVIVIGGGIFGVTAAIVLGEAGHEVILLEKRYDLMLESSMVNQGRIHMGYHYPRSPETIREALEALDSFSEYFGSSCVSDFVNYYAIAKDSPHTDVDTYMRVCEQMNLPLTEGYPPKDVLDRSKVEACWITPETIFDYHAMRYTALCRVRECDKIRVVRNVWPSRIEVGNVHRIELANGGRFECDVIVNATYTAINDILRLIGRPPMRYQFELCLEPILEIDDPPDRFGVAVMDGPFCSLMPKGTEPGRFIAYHVIHSVLQAQVNEEAPNWGPIEGFPEFRLIEESSEYFPIMRKMDWRESWITTRVVIAGRDHDDARLTFVVDHGEHVYTIFSGKLTTCVNVAKKLLRSLDDA